MEQRPEEAVGHLRVVAAPVGLTQVEALVADGAGGRLQQLEAVAVRPGAVVGAAARADPRRPANAVPGRERGPHRLHEPPGRGRHAPRDPRRGVVIEQRAVRQNEVHGESVGALPARRPRPRERGRRAARTLARMWKTIGLLSVVCLGFIGLLVGLSLGGMG